MKVEKTRSWFYALCLISMIFSMPAFGLLDKDCKIHTNNSTFDDEVEELINSASNFTWSDDKIAAAVGTGGASLAVAAIALSIVASCFKSCVKLRPNCAQGCVLTVAAVGTIIAGVTNVIWNEDDENNVCPLDFAQEFNAVEIAAFHSLVTGLQKAREANSIDDVQSITKDLAAKIEAGEIDADEMLAIASSFSSDQA